MCVQPDLVSYHTVLSALQRSGRGIEAEAMLVRMSHLSISGGNPGEGTDVCVDARCFNTVLKAYHSMARQWAHSTNDSTIDSTSDSTKDASTQPPWVRARNLLASAQTLGVTPNAVSYALVAESCLEAGEYLIARTMHAHGCARLGVPGDTTEDQHRVLSNFEARLWKSWSHAQLKLVLDLVLAHQEIKADSAAWEKLSSSLSVALIEGIMPEGFQDGGARAGYTLGRLMSRSQKVADSLLHQPSRDFWLRGALRELLVRDNARTEREGEKEGEENRKGGKEGGREACRVLSVGGGPGFDFIALVLLSDFFGLGFEETLPIDALVTDYEPSWRSDASYVARAVAQSQPQRRPFAGSTAMHSADFATADITLPMAHADNEDLASVLRAPPVGGLIFVASYVVAENAVRLREGKFIFFRDLARLAPPGSLFLMTETSHHMWPEVLKVTALGFLDDPVYTAESRDPLKRLPVAFPRITRKRGFSLCFRKPFPTECQHSSIAQPATETGVSAAPATSVERERARERGRGRERSDSGGPGALEVRSAGHVASRTRRTSFARWLWARTRTRRCTRRLSRPCTCPQS
jgi:hypothetical protein